MVRLTSLAGLTPGASVTLRALRGLAPSAVVITPPRDGGGPGAPYPFPPAFSPAAYLRRLREEEAEILALISAALQTVLH
jgi:hypothetical protein